MFIIVENQSVILGPMPWRPTYFKSVLLDDLEIDYNVPLSNANNDPIIISESVQILPVTEIGVIGELNNKIQFANGPYYNFYPTYAEYYYLPENKSIDLVKSEFKQIVAANRYKYESMGITVTIQGKDVFVFTSRGDRDIYLQAYQMGKTDVNWKFGDEFLVLTNADLGSIVLAVSTHVQNTFDWESGKVSEIDACTTLAELDTLVLKSDNSDWEKEEGMIQNV